MIASYHIILPAGLCLLAAMAFAGTNDAQPLRPDSSAPATQPSVRDPHLSGRVANQDWRQMPGPVIDGPFVRPAAQPMAQPIWGHRDGLRVGLYPLPGPRGLLRIYAPYLGHEEGRVINFIAIEPIVQGQDRRDLSELEHSELDDAPGKRFWPADSPEEAGCRPAEDHPARGAIHRQGDIQVLQVYVIVEPFKSGARPYVRLTFRSDRPYELGIATFARKGSVPMDRCIVTATMGNFARLRQLHLADRVVSANDLWPDCKDDWFAPHKSFGLSDMFRTPAGAALAAAATDEPNAQEVTSGFPHLAWQYYGRKATQYWRCEKPDPQLCVQVNGRFTYYNSKAPIPGGIAFENFEMVEPFHDGQEVWFGVTPVPPDRLYQGEAR